MLGVMRETLEREGGSIRGDEDFFSVARTTPLVAKNGSLVLGVADYHMSSQNITFDS